MACRVRLVTSAATGDARRDLGGYTIDWPPPP